MLPGTGLTVAQAWQMSSELERALSSMSFQDENGDFDEETILAPPLARGFPKGSSGNQNHGPRCEYSSLPSCTAHVFVIDPSCKIFVFVFCFLALVYLYTPLFYLHHVFNCTTAPPTSPPPSSTITIPTTAAITRESEPEPQSESGLESQPGDSD